MGIRDVMAYLKTRQAADTPDTPEKNMGYQEKALQINADTPDTPDTSKNINSRENFPACPVNSMLATAANPPGPDLWSWPHSAAMNMAEIDAFSQRASVFNRRGMPSVEAEGLAYRLVNRDRDGDDRRLCLECVHLAGSQPGSWSRGGWRCGQWQQAGMGATGVPAGLVMVLQRCDGFRPAR